MPGRVGLRRVPRIHRAQQLRKGLLTCTPQRRGVRTIIVESATCFARDLIVEETDWRMFRDAGITLVAADSFDAFLDDTPTAVMIRQI